MSTVKIARGDRGMPDQYRGQWLHFVVYDFGVGALIARLFVNRRGAEHFVTRRVKHKPIYWGRVRFK